MNRYVFFIVFVVFFSCKKDAKAIKTAIIEDAIEQTDSVKFTTTNLRSSAKFTGDWAEILTFENELKRVLNAKLQTEKDVSLLKELLEKVKETYPEKFKTLPIESRVKVLETEILMLEQDLKDGFLADINSKKERVQKAYNIFVSQIETLLIKEKDYERYN